MISTTFFERRKESRQVNFDRRVVQRRKEVKSITLEQRRLASQTRHSERNAFKVPALIKIHKIEIPGYTYDISQEDLLVISDTPLSPGTPTLLQFSFGENVSSLNISGQVLLCRLVENGESHQQAIVIKFTGIQSFEQKLLTSSIQELKQIPTMYEKSSLKILVVMEVPAQEKTDFIERRQFELPLSFPDRRKDQRRKKNIPGLQERRECLREDKNGLLSLIETLKIGSLRIHPRLSIKIVLAEIAGIKPNEVEESTEIRSLGLDSFQMIEMLAAIETAYKITLDEETVLQLITVRDLIDLIHGCMTQETSWK